MTRLLAARSATGIAPALRISWQRLKIRPRNDQGMIKAVLLDLDDTLLRVDTDAFVARYLGGLNGIVQRDYPALGQGLFGKTMAQAVRAMAENVDPTRTNLEIFTQTINAKIDLSQD